jgi:hypothetical protein
MDLMTAIDAIPGIGPFLPWIAGIVAVASALAPLLPAPAGGGAYATVYRVVNFVALNLGHAKNATAPVATPK